MGRTAVDDVAQTFVAVLQQKLMSLQLCSSEEEYASVSDAIASSYSSVSVDEVPRSKEELEEVVSKLVDYIEGDAAEHQAKVIIHAVATEVWGDVFAENLGWNDSGTADDDKNEVNVSGDNRIEEAESDDGDFVGEGDCQLCERTVKLTRHHLIPKTTWPRIKKRLWNAASIIETYRSLDDDSSNHETKEITKMKLEKTLGMSDIANIPKTITHDSIRSYLSEVALLCRQCHSAVHRIHTEMELATEYNTIDRLFSDGEILKFGKWASKQKPGKYSV